MDALPLDIHTGLGLYGDTMSISSEPAAMMDASPEDSWLSSDEGAEWVIRTVDSIVDSVTDSEFVKSID